MVYLGWNKVGDVLADALNGPFPLKILCKLKAIAPYYGTTTVVHISGGRFVTSLINKFVMVGCSLFPASPTINRRVSEEEGVGRPHIVEKWSDIANAVQKILTFTRPWSERPDASCVGHREYVPTQCKEEDW